MGVHLRLFTNTNNAQTVLIRETAQGANTARFVKQLISKGGHTFNSLHDIRREIINSSDGRVLREFAMREPVQRQISVSPELSMKSSNP